MARLWQQIIKGEKGQALPIVLIMLGLGGLLIAPSLNYVSTSLNAGQIVEKNVSGLYAADAGVENTLWCLKNLISPPTQLPENVNQMQVAIQTEPKGTYTLYFGELVGVGEPPQTHYDWVTVDGEMVWEELAEAYKYTITVTWQPESGQPTIHLEEIGVRLPLGYSYQPGSAASFGNNLSIGEPNVSQDWFGVYMLGWEFPPPRPEVSLENPTATQTFYVTGEGELEGDYSWVVADPSSIGVVGEVIGTLYKITATATRPEDGEITAKIATYVLVEPLVAIHILSWQINPQ